eukprot:RCo015348
MKFLVGVDGSEHAIGATLYLKTLLRPSDEVVVYTASKTGSVDPAVTAKAKSVFADTGAQLEVQEDSKVDPREGIRDCASKKNVDIVVVGSRGQGVLKRAFLGSVSSDVAQTQGRSVLIVHRPELERNRTFMICADGSETILRATRMLTNILKPDDHVVIYTGFIPPPLMVATGRVVLRNPQYEQELLEAQERALGCVDEVRQALLEATVLPANNIATKVEGSNEPRDAAIEFADTNHLQTIVCGSRGLGTIRRLLFGSFSTHLIHNATKHAVLVVH